ncbi:MAG: hypothetical protein HYW49_00410 [Deltaproteobacteria bacterium]|nr:hypothetical protein [Deltaproteobacteria bacterium]
MAEDLLKQSKELFNQRQAFGKEDPALLDQIEEKLNAANKEAQDADLKYDILVAHSKILYWKGNHTSEKDPAKKVYESGYKKAEEAKAINVDYPEAYYYYAVNLARWAKKNGIVESLQRKGELMDNLNKVLERTTRDGIAGEEIEYFGANRVLGKMYYELPGFAGGSRSRSVENLSVAHEKAPNHSLNVIYYAEALSKGAKEEQAKACAILKEMLAKNPAEMIADRVQETTEDFEDAKELISKLRCK